MSEPERSTNWPIAFAMSVLFIVIGTVICFTTWALTR